jgi:hypothetical protein
MATYPKAEVDAIMDELLGALENSLTLNKSASAAQAEVAELRVKLATSGPPVVLQQVSTEPTLDPELLNQTLRDLVDTAYLHEDDVPKMAATLKKDPNALLKLASRIATLSTPAHESGHGVKSASTRTPLASDEWDIVREKGA